MFYFLSKLLTLFLMPFFWLFLFITIGLFAKLNTRRKKYLKIAFFILLFFGNNFISTKVMHWWEPKAKPLHNLENCDIAIVLGGGIANENRWPFDRVHFDHSADRLLQAYQLYKMGKVKKILVSAGSLSAKNISIERTEADVSKKFLKLAGVSESDIILENRSKNTFQNAVFTKEVLKNLNLGKSKLLLITSAYHLPRSQACFAKQGLTTIAYPCDLHYVTSSYLSFETYIPDEVSFNIWYDLFHEWYGLLAYKLMGYI